MFGRRWATIDVAERAVVKEWGLLVPFKGRSFRLDDYSVVTLGFIRGDSDSSHRFPVGLKAPAGPDLLLCSLTTYVESRECAAAVSGLLQWDVEDASTDHPIRLTAGEAERPLRQQVMARRRTAGGDPSAERENGGETRAG